MKFLQSLIKESILTNLESTALIEADQRVSPDQIYAKYGEFACLVKWLEIENYEQTSREYDGDVAYVTYDGLINSIAVLVRRGDEEYFVEVYPPNPIESTDTNPAWLQNADVDVFSSQSEDGAAIDKTDPELSSMLEKLVRGFLLSNWKALISDVFTKEETIERKRGFPVRNDDLADY